jgi:hypothetical protein
MKMQLFRTYEYVLAVDSQASRQRLLKAKVLYFLVNLRKALSINRGLLRIAFKMRFHYMDDVA